MVSARHVRGREMPRGPKGAKRPADVIGNAVHVMRIATGEIEEDLGKAPKRAKGGRKGAQVRASRLTLEQKSNADHLLAMVDQRLVHYLPRRFVNVVVVEC
jgi:hypothetical protein